MLLAYLRLEFPQAVLLLSIALVLSRFRLDPSQLGHDIDPG